MNRVLLVALAFALVSWTIPSSKPRIFLIGDSTMATKRAEVFPEQGWGTPFASFIDLEVLNHAVNGRSTKSFRTLGHWQKVEEALQPGDYVFIQFGHNDSKESDTVRYAPAQTDYRENLTRYIKEIKAKGAHPVLITPVMRRKFDKDGVFIDQHGEYPQVVKEVGKKWQVPVLDLHASSKVLIEQLGVEESKKMFLNLEKDVYDYYKDGKEDNTHFTPYGASQIAALVAKGIRNLKLPIAESLIKYPVGDVYVSDLPKIMEVSFRKDTFNIVSYGARPDGITLNTKAIADAIEACHKAGGGTVLIPRGMWLSGPIQLKSHVNLHIVREAVLQFSDDPTVYPLIKTNWEGLEAIRAHSPIYAVDAENIAITGGGILDGAGQAWRPVKKNKVTPPEWNALVKSGGALNEKKDIWYPTERALKGSLDSKAGVVAAGYTIDNAQEIHEFLRPNMVSIVRSKRILLEGVTFQNSPAWCIHPLLSQHITMRNIIVRNPWNAQNGDGIDLESCRYVNIDGCYLDVGDDGLCIKSGRDEEGRKRGVPTEDVIITNSTVFHGHGGFVVGSEMSGGARNIFVSDCNFLGTDVGLRFKTTRGRGGVVENIYIHNVRMNNIGGGAILFDMYYAAKDPLAMFAGDEKPSIEFQPVSKATPQFKNIFIKNVVCKGAETGIFVRGLPEMNIKNIHMEDISIESKQGFVCTEGEQITLKNATLICKDPIVVEVQDSKNIVLDKINYANDKTFMKVFGDRSRDIQINQSVDPKNKEAVQFGKGVSSKVVKTK